MLNKSLLKALGPGILFASTCIGVSHLVQSTRAGADYGFDLVWAIVLANLFKYPFFEFASRYANATGTSIIDGYKRLGKGVLWLYLIITVATMFFVCAVVGVVTAGFLDNLFDITGTLKTNDIPHANLGAPITVFVVCIGILLAGKYKMLDSIIKVIGAVLLTSTLLSFVLALLKGPAGDVPMRIVNFEDALPLFVVPLMGWMPTALDLPMIDTVIVEVPNPKHPFGVRGVAEVSLVPHLAALANAIYQATGVRFTNAPIKPSVISEALNKAQ